MFPYFKAAEYYEFYTTFPEKIYYSERLDSLLFSHISTDMAHSFYHTSKIGNSMKAAQINLYNKIFLMLQIILWMQVLLYAAFTVGMFLYYFK